MAWDFRCCHFPLFFPSSSFALPFLTMFAISVLNSVTFLLIWHVFESFHTISILTPACGPTSLFGHPYVVWVSNEPKLTCLPTNMPELCATLGGTSNQSEQCSTLRGTSNRSEQYSALTGKITILEHSLTCLDELHPIYIYLGNRLRVSNPDMLGLDCWAIRSSRLGSDLITHAHMCSGHALTLSNYMFASMNCSTCLDDAGLDYTKCVPHSIQMLDPAVSELDKVCCSSSLGDLSSVHISLELTCYQKTTDSTVFKVYVFHNMSILLCCNTFEMAVGNTLPRFA